MSLDDSLIRAHLLLNGPLSPFSAWPDYNNE